MIHIRVARKPRQSLDSLSIFQYFAVHWAHEAFVKTAEKRQATFPEYKYLCRRGKLDRLEIVSVYYAITHRNAFFYL